MGTGDHSAGFPQNSQNVIALCGLQVFLHLHRVGLAGSFSSLTGTFNDRSARENYGPFNKVFHLPNIARPVPVTKCVHRRLRNPLDFPAHLTRIFLGEVVNEKRNIGFSLAKRRRDDWKYSQAIVQVAAKLVIGNHLGEVAIGGSNESHIHVYRSRASQPFELALLQNP